MRAILVETHGRLDGTMTDLEPDYEVPYKRYINGLPERDWAKAESFARSFKSVTVRLCLPERSRLSGRVEGDRVEFVKRYDGPQTVLWISEGREIEKETIERPTVLYRGSFDRGGEVVDGRWTIPRRGLRALLGGNDGQGAFHLCRHRC